MKYIAKIPVHITTTQLVETEVEFKLRPTEDQLCAAGCRELRKIFPIKKESYAPWEWYASDGSIVEIEVGAHLFVKKEDG
jgi:hypothetical protein